MPAVSEITSSLVRALGGLQFLEQAFLQGHRHGPLWQVRLEKLTEFNIVATSLSTLRRERACVM